MKNENNGFNLPRLYAVLLYITGFLLFLEWLYPIPIIGVTMNILPFIYFAIYCFLLSLIQLKWWMTFFLKGFGLVFLLSSLFMEESFFSFDWLGPFIEEFSWNLGVLITGELQVVTPLFRSFLFMVLIWLMSYLLYYWFVQIRRVLLFVILTVLYITLLDTFSDYNASNAIIRILIYSIFGLAIANFTRDMEKESISPQADKRAFNWLGILVVTVLFSFLVGAIGPKLEPQWPDPVPFIENASERASGTGNHVVQKVGYGEDDSRLGGSFIQDDTPVFRAEVNKEHYWRVEVKDYYTGKGWDQAVNPVYRQQPDSHIQLETFYSSVETEEYIASVQFNENEIMDKLVYPYGLKVVEKEAPHAHFYLERMTEAIEVLEDNTRVSLSNYEMVYDYPSFSVDALLSSSESNRDSLQAYLQLPETLPNRVAELAKEITSGYATRYEKAKAIEQYFNQNGFTYQTTDVAIPGEEDDYVDQFLFETKVGYCDNFSTSMVIMLRTLDIPARWAKGFTSGEKIGQGSDTEVDMYEITNANAHSWVEVYFPETGWVPFEPTQGFTNPMEFYSDREGTASEQNEENFELPEEIMEPEEEQIDDERDLEGINEGMVAEKNHVTSWIIGIFVGIILLTGLYVLYKYRFTIQARYYLQKLEQQADSRSFQSAYFFLLRLLAKKLTVRKENQTLSEYASFVDEKYGMEAMKELTVAYEKMLYSDSFDETKLPYLTKVWRDLVKQIMG